MVIKRVKTQPHCSWKFHSVSLHRAANCVSPWLQTNGQTALKISQLNTWKRRCQRRTRLAAELGEPEHPGRSAILRRGCFPAPGDAQLAGTRRCRIHRLAAEEPPSPSCLPQPPVNTQHIWVLPASVGRAIPCLQSFKEFNSLDIPVVHYLRSQIKAKQQPWLPSIISHSLIERMVGDLLM